MDDDDDLLTAMARELVTRQGVGERAAEVWRSLQVQRGEASEPGSSIVPADAEPVASETEADAAWSRVDRTTPAVQLSLF
jgi:hypothetical protein